MDHQRARSALNSVHSAVCVGSRPWAKRLVASFGTLAVAFALSTPAASASPVYQAAMVPAAFHVLAATQSPRAEDAMGLSSETLLEEFKARTPEDAMKIAPFVELGALDSKPGEAKDAFMMRVARILDAFTTATRHEACGAVMKSATGEAWRVRLITNRSQMACMRIMFDENGFEPTTETIHSHPRPKRFEGVISVRISRADMRLGVGVCGRHAKLDDESFSPRDLTNGSGYLVARGKLLYHDHDNGEQKVIGVIDPSVAMDALSVGGTADRPYTQDGLHAARAAWVSGEVEGLPSLACQPIPKR